MTPKPIEPAPEWAVKAKELDARIRNYLGNGGLFNPEMMEHDKVQKLIFDLQDFLSRIIADHAPKEAEVPPMPAPIDIAGAKVTELGRWSCGTSLSTDEDVAREIHRYLGVGLTYGKVIANVTAHIAAHTAGLRAERDALARWKEEAMTVESWWKEIDTFIRKHPKCPLGHSVPAIALGWLRDRDNLRAEVERLTKKGQKDAHDFSAAMNQRHETNWAEISSLRAELKETQQYMLLVRLEAGCPDDQVLVIHCRELRAALNASEERVKQYSTIATETVPGIHGEGEEVNASPNYLRSLITNQQKEWDRAESDLTAARDKIAALEQDGARLDWMEKGYNLAIDHAVWAPHMPLAGQRIIHVIELDDDSIDQIEERGSGPSIRAALDAAISAIEKNPQ